MPKHAMTLILLAISTVCGCSSRSQNDTEDGAGFPTRNLSRVELPPDESQIEVRVVNRSDNGQRIKNILTEFRNGVTEWKFFRENETLELIVQHYPVGENTPENSKRRLRMTLVYDEDGKTLLYERAYREDGTAAVFGSRRADGNFRRENFFPDGKIPATIEIIDKSGLVLIEQIFKTDGMIDQVVRRDKRGNTVTEDYRENGTLETVTSRPRSNHGPVERTFFSESGLEVVLFVRFNSSSVHVRYYQNGEVVEERDVFRTGFVNVSTKDKKGNLLVRRYSGKPGSPNWADTRDLQLKGLQEHNGDGKLIREIKFHEDGRTPKEIRYPDTSNTIYKSLYKYFREDGTLEKEEYKESYNETRDEKEYTPEDNIREEIPEEYFDLPEREAPKLLSQMPEEANYGCENCCGEGCEYCMP